MRSIKQLSKKITTERTFMDIMQIVCMYLIDLDQLPKEEIAMIKAIIIKAHAEIVFIVLGFVFSHPAIFCAVKP